MTLPALECARLGTFALREVSVLTKSSAALTLRSEIVFIAFLVPVLQYRFPMVTILLVAIKPQGLLFSLHLITLVGLKSNNVEVAPIAREEWCLIVPLEDMETQLACPPPFVLVSADLDSIVRWDQ